jgi:hypothetical protein
VSDHRALLLAERAGPSALDLGAPLSQGGTCATSKVLLASASGSLDSNLAGHGTWSLVGDRITEHGDHGVFSFMIEKLAGTLHMYGRSPGGGWVDVTGSYCK